MFILDTIDKVFNTREIILFSAKCHYGLEIKRILFLSELESSYKCCVRLDFMYCNFHHNGIECLVETCSFGLDCSGFCFCLSHLNRFHHTSVLYKTIETRIIIHITLTRESYRPLLNRDLHLW